MPDGARQPLVLAYHAVTTDWRHPLAIDPDRFREQLHKLAARGFRGATFTAAATGESPGRLAVITFDDGFRSAAEHALPVFDELGWPATVFTVTSTATNGDPMRWLSGELPAPDDALLPLRWSELVDLAARGWEIGSHASTHRLLSELDDADLEAELRSSRKEIVERIGACTSISYPWGEVDGRVVAAARAAGYVAGSGLAGRFRKGDPMAVPRFAVSGSDGRLRYRLKTSPTFWRLRSTPLWTWLDSLRHPASPAEGRVVAPDPRSRT